MGPPSYMRSVVDRNVVMRRIPVITIEHHNSSINKVHMYNIKMDLEEVGWVGMDCIDAAQDRDRWQAIMNLRVLDNAWNFFTS